MSQRWPTQPAGADPVLIVDASVEDELVVLDGLTPGRTLIVRREDTVAGRTARIGAASAAITLDGVPAGSLTIDPLSEMRFYAVDGGYVSTGSGSSEVEVDAAIADEATARTAAIAAQHATDLTTYGQLWATPAASATLTGTLAAWTVTSVDCTAGSGARSLPAASSVAAGTAYVAKKGDTSTNALTVSRAGSDLIFGTGAGVTTKVITLPGEAVEFVSNGVDRYTVRASDTPSGVLSTTYGPGGTAGNPRKQFVDVRDFGILTDTVGSGDDTAGLQAALDSLGNGPGTVYLPRRAQTGGFGIYWLSAPLVFKSGQNIVGDGINVVTLKARSDFSGTAMVLSNTWTTGGGGSSYLHWASVENMRIDCASVAPIGVAIHAMGECTVLRRLLLLNATDSNIVLTGAHAPVGIEHVSSNNAVNYGLKLTTHPTYPGNSGCVRLTGYSGDNNVGAHLYCDGSHGISVEGWKSESHTVGFLVAGSSSPTIFATGYFNTGQTTPDLFKITGTAAPRITSLVRTNGVTNLINDTVNSRTVPATIATVLPLLTYGGKNVLSGPVVRGRYTQTRTGNGAVAIDASLGDIHDVTLAGNATSTTISNATVGQELTLTFIQDGSGNRTYVWPTANYSGATAPANISTASRRDTATLVYDGTSWNEKSRGQSGAVTSVTPARSGRWLTAPSPVSQTSNGTITAGSLRYMPITFDRAGTVTDIGIWVPTGVGSATVRLGLYADNDGQPTGAALADSGALDASSSSTFKSVTGLTVPVSAGRYWVAAVTQGVAANLVGVLGVANGIAATGSYSGSDVTSWVDAASTTGALPSANPTSHGRGMLVNVKVA